MPTTSTARQIVAPEYGGPDVLTTTEAELPPPGPGEVLIEVRAAGVNPADYKGFSGLRSTDPAALPIHPGFEVAGTIAAIGPATEIASGGGAVGDAVVAFRVSGGYASAIVVPAGDVFAKPDALDFPSAANLLLVGTTAADMLRVVEPAAGEVMLVHGASGAVGVSILQQARLVGARVIGTASPGSFETVRRFGGEPVAYGDGLADRVRALAPDGIDAALDCIGTDEAVDVSLEFVAPERFVTIAAFPRAQQEGLQAVAGATPESASFRDTVRSRLLELAASGDLVVPVAQTYPLDRAGEALAFLSTGHPGGKLALIP